MCKEKWEVLTRHLNNTQGKADAPRNFERAVWIFFEALGFTQDPHEKSMWVRGLGTDDEVIVVTFCDDFIIAANCEAAHRKFEIELTKRWGDCDVKEPTFLLGCDVVQTKSSIRLTAATKIKNILDEHNMTTCNGSDTPLPPSTVIDVRHCPAEGKKLPFPYRRLLGQLGYIAIACRPTLAHAVSQLARVQNNPSKKHWDLLKGILKYVKATQHAGVEFSVQDEATLNRMVAYSDSSWADIPGGILDPRVKDGRKSTLGHILIMNGGAIAWKSHVSQIVALSSAEAELFATVECAKCISSTRRLLAHVGEPQAPTPSTLWCDSTSAVSINSKRNTSSKLRHLEIKWFHCRYLAEAGIIQTKHIDGDHNPSDLFTKSLGKTKFQYFAEMMESGQTWSRKAANGVANAVHAFRRNFVTFVSA